MSLTVNVQRIVFKMAKNSQDSICLTCLLFLMRDAECMLRVMLRSMRSHSLGGDL